MPWPHNTTTPQPLSLTPTALLVASCSRTWPALSLGWGGFHSGKVSGSNLALCGRLPVALGGDVVVVARRGGEGCQQTAGWGDWQQSSCLVVSIDCCLCVTQ